MSLSLTPINEAWNTTKAKTKPKQQKTKPNIYSSPETQSKILSELGMIENFEVQPEIEESKEIQVYDSNSLNINLKNKNLINMLKPYSNEYIETILLNCINNNNQSGISHELVDTIETIYMMVALILLLFIIDILFKLRKN